MKKRMVILLSILMLTTTCISPVFADEVLEFEQTDEYVSDDADYDDDFDYEIEDYYESSDEDTSIDLGGNSSETDDYSSEYNDSSNYDNSIDFAGEPSSETEQPSQETVEQAEQPEQTESAEQTPNPPEQSGASQPEKSEPPQPKSPDEMNFDEKFIDYITKNYRTENFVISPVSLETALCSVAYSADGKTSREIMDFLGFEDEEEMLSWHKKMMSVLKTFKKKVNQDKEKKGYIARSLRILNSIWNNTSVSGNLKKKYIEDISKTLKVHVDEQDTDHITENINKWYKKKTDGKLEKIATDFSQSDRTFISSSYISSAWKKMFEQGESITELFVAADGTPSQQVFMQKIVEIPYYSNQNGNMIVLPLRGDLYVAMSIGDINPIEHLDEAKKSKTYIKIPKFETVTTLNPKIIADFLRPYGVETVYSNDADFSKMSVTDFQFYNLLQKNKITLDENGINADEQSKKKSEEVIPSGKEKFVANEPFHFYIYYKPAEQPILIYYGQHVK